MVHDLFGALRSLRKRPGLALAVVGPFAVAIGPVLAVYSLVHLFLWGPVGLPEADRLVHLSQQLPKLGGEAPLSAASYLTLLEQQRATDSGPFEQFAVFQTDQRTLGGRGEPVRVNIARVTPSFFELGRTRALLGRRLLPEDARLSAPEGTILGSGSSVVLSHSLWRRLFGASHEVVGDSVDLDGRRYEVVGVMPPGFRFPEETEAWIPLGFGDVAPMDFGGFYIQGLGRLAPGATQSEAAAFLERAAVQLRPAAPQITAEMSFLTTPLRESVYGDYQTPALLLLVLTLLILLGVTTSGAQLLWARAISRQGDLALRTALGASRRSLARLVLFEGLLLALVGWSLGLAFGKAILSVFESAVPVRAAAAPALEAPVVAFSLIVALAGSAILGAVPLLALRRNTLNRHLFENTDRVSEGRGGLRMRRILLASQLALGLVLLANALVLMESFNRLRSVPLGFEPAGLTTIDLEMPPSRYDPAELRSFVDRVLPELAGLPGAEGAAAALRLPVVDVGGGIWFDVPAAEGVPGATAIPATFNPVTPGFFRQLRVAPAAGRELTPEDREGGEPVAVIDETLARKYFGSASPLDRHIVLTPWPDVRRRIVGVVPALRYGGLEDAPSPAVYVPYHQLPFGQLRLLVRHDPGVTIPPRALYERVWGLDPHLAPVETGELADRLERLVEPQRWAVRLVIALGSLGLLLAVAAVYGATRQIVSQRQRELGIRSVLGCSQQGMVRHVVWGRVPDLAGGIALGLVGLWIAGRWSRSVLYEISPYDPLWLTASLLLLIGVTLLALYLPARRAATIDPATLLH